MAIYSFTIPDFVSGQKLRATDLNHIVDLIEPPGKLARRSLVGTGVGCGLEISTSKAAIPGSNPAKDGVVVHVSPGAAVTSDGCLFYLENGGSFEVESAAKLVDRSIFKPGPTGTMVEVWEFVKLTGAPSASMETFPGTQPTPIPGQPEAPPSLLDWCLVLVKTQKDGNANATVFCASDLDPTGAATTFDVCLFAIKESDLSSLWTPPGGGGGGSFPALPFPFVRRLSLSPLQPLPDSYFTACEAALLPGGAVQTALVAAFPTGGANYATALLADLNTVRTSRPILLQYFWAYLKDWVAAFEEWALAQAQVTVQSDCPVNVDDFPNFVALGPRPDCRMGFYPAKAVAQSLCDLEKVAKAGFLKARLEWLSDHHHLHFEDSAILIQTPVEITGSQPKHLPLSQLAIPFYYQNQPPPNDVLRPLWNFELQRVQRGKLVPGYVRADGTPPFEQPLSYDLEKFEFYRVEGHVGKEYVAAFTEIRNQRNALNLPFKIVLVRLQVNTVCPASDAFVRAATHPLTFDRFAQVRPGLEHQGGVPKGGTLVLVIAPETVNSPSQTCVVVADFCLPYSQEERPSALFNEKSREKTVAGVVTLTLENASLNAEYFIWEVWRFQSGIVGDSLILIETTVKTDHSAFIPNLANQGQLTKIRVRLTAYHDMWESSYEEDFVLVEAEPPVEKAKPVAIFHERWRKFEATPPSKGQRPLVKLRFDNDSVHATKYDWKVIVVNPDDSDGSAVTFSTDSGKSFIQIDDHEVTLTANHLRITLKASNDEGDEDTFVQNVYLCPDEMRLVIRRDEQTPWVEEVNLQLKTPGEVPPDWELEYYPPGCRLVLLPTDGFSAMVTKDNSNDDRATLQITGVPPPGDLPVTVTVSATYPCTGWERQVRIVIQPTPPQGRPGAAIVVTRPLPTPSGGTVVNRGAAESETGETESKSAARSASKPFNSVLSDRRNGYRRTVEKMAESDRKLAATKSYKNTHHFLTVAPANFDDLHEQYADLAKLLLASAAKPGGIADELYLALLQNATWHYLDRCVAGQPDAVPPALQANLQAALPKLAEAGVALQDFRQAWHGEALKNNGNEALINSLHELLK